MKIIKYISYLWQVDWISTLRFNFHYFQFKDAIRIPVFLFRCKIISLKGEVILKQPIKTGMIKLGMQMVSVSYFPFNFIYENKGGVIFLESGELGSGSAISVQKGAKLSIGEHIHATSNVKIIVSESITIGDNCRIGWDTMIMDTSWHSIYNIVTESYSSKSSPIRIGNYTWIGNGCQLMKGCVTPDFSIIGARSLLTKDLKAPSYCLIVGSPAKVVREGVMLDEFVKFYSGAKHDN